MFCPSNNNTVMLSSEWACVSVSGLFSLLFQPMKIKKSDTNLPSFARLHTVTFLSCTKTHEMHHTSIVCLQSFQSCLNCAVTPYCKHFVCVWADAVTRWSFAPSQIHQKHRYRRERCCATLEDLQQSKPAYLIAPNVFSMYAALAVPR